MMVRKLPPTRWVGVSLMAAIVGCSPAANVANVPVPIVSPVSNTGSGGPGPKPAASTQHRVFVSSLSDDSIGVFDYGTGSRLAVITDPSLNQPAGVTVSGTNLYVANSGSDTVSVFDATKYTYLKTLDGNGLKQPTGLVATGGQVAKLFVVNANGGTLSVFNASTGSANGQVQSLGSPLGIAVFGSTATGSNVYVSGANQNVDLVNYQSLAQNGSFAQHTIDVHYGVAYGYGNIYVTNFLSSSVDVYNVNTFAYETTLTGNFLSGPCGVAVGGGRIYVANFFPDSTGNSEVSQFDATTNAAVTTNRFFYQAKSTYLTYF